MRCAVSVVVNGDRAIQFIQEIESGEEPSPDLVIIDLNLPKRSGKEVLRQMRASRVFDQATVVILTSSDSQKDKDDVARLGPALYLKKPPKLDDFLALGSVFKRILGE